MRRFLVVVVLFVWAFLVFQHTEKIFYPIKYKESVIKFSKQYNLEPELVFAIIKAESGFDQNAVSKKRAIGLMQLMSETAMSGAKSNGITDFSEELLFDPEINIKLGCWHLGKLFSEYTSITVVVASYNAGGKNIKNWFDTVDYKTLSDEEVYRNIRFPETKNFVRRVLNNYLQYKKIYSRDLLK